MIHKVDLRRKEDKAYRMKLFCHGVNEKRNGGEEALKEEFGVQDRNAAEAQVMVDFAERMKIAVERTG